MEVIDKSILIIATPRTGSTSLLSSFSKRFHIFNEPLNPLKTDKLTSSEFFNLISTKKNIVVKTIVDHIPSKYMKNGLPPSWERFSGLSTNGSSWTFHNMIDFYLDAIKHFDLVVLLDRTDVNAQIESNKRIAVDYCSKNNFKFDIEDCLKYLFYQKYLIRQVSKKLDIALNFYEEIYYGDTKNILKNSGIDLNWIDLTKLDTNRKYRGNLYSPYIKKII